ncbi:uncharacterized protein [Setaria viridis]|uniref:uncharacterized protein n=1 Tax=Setaria viridis TaxID=4556 RepID=UPI0007199FF7
MAGKEDLKLLGLLVSPFVIRVRMALSTKGVSYEYVEQDLFNKSELLLKSNPVHKKVPVLIHNGKPLCESLVIVQYVDELFAGPSILPTDLYERATARFWAAFVDDKLCPAWIGILKAKTEDERAEKVTETSAAIGQMEEAFDKCSEGKAFFGGDSIGYLDIVFGSCLFWFEAVRRMFGVEIISANKAPLLTAWAERFRESAEAKEVVPGADEAVQYANKLAAAAAKIELGCLAMAAKGGELKLLGVWDSPYVNRVQIMLNLKGISYEYIEEDLLNKSKLLLNSNPVHKKVPVLIHDGKPIAESQVIVQYLDEVFSGTGPSVLPADPYKRATARFWAAFVDDKVGSPWHTILFAREAEKKADAAARIITALGTLEGAFKDCSRGGDYFGGDGIGFVDVVLGSYLGWFKVFEKMVGVRVLDAARTPLLAAWGERFAAADAAKDVLPSDVDKVIEFLQTFLD